MAQSLPSVWLRMAPLAVLVVLASVAAAGHSKAGFRFALYEKGINKAVPVYMPNLVKKIGELSIDSFEGTTAGMHYKLTEIQVVHVDIPVASIYGTFDAINQQLYMTSNGGTVQVKAHFDVKSNAWSRIGSTGYATVTMSKAHASVGVGYNVGDDGSGQCFIKTKSQISFDSFSVKVAGSWFSWLYDVIAFIAQDVLKSVVEKSLTTQLDSVVLNEGIDLMKKVPWPIKENDNGLSIDFRMPEPFEMVNDGSQNRMEGYVNGEWFVTGARQPTEGEHHRYPRHPPPKIAERDFVFYFDEYYFDTIAHAFFQSNKMKTSVSDYDISTDSPLRLNTRSWQDVIPALYTQYPDRPMVAEFFATQPTMVSVMERGLLLEQKGEVLFYVTSEDRVKQFVFSLTGNVVTEVHQLQISDDALLTGWTSTMKITNLSTGRTAIGDFPLGTTSTIEKLLDIAANSFGVKKFNDYLQKGITVPTTRAIKYKDMEVHLTDDGFAIVAGTVRWFLVTDDNDPPTPTPEQSTVA